VRCSRNRHPNRDLHLESAAAPAVLVVKQMIDNPVGTGDLEDSSCLTTLPTHPLWAHSAGAPLQLAALLVGGFISLALFLYGMQIDHDSAANFVPVNTTDNYLHLALGIGMIALGALLGRRVPTRITTSDRG